MLNRVVNLLPKLSRRSIGPLAWHAVFANTTQCLKGFNRGERVKKDRSRIPMPASEIQRQVYRDKFRSLHNEAFQAWFEQLLVALNPAGDFQAIRKTTGDGGLDGFVISKEHAYQAYAPARIAELNDSKTATKIRTDFAKAHSTLGGQLRAWTFVHNHPEGKLAQRSAATVAHLKAEHPDVEVFVLDINSLWEMLDILSDAQLAKLFGPSGADGLKAELLSRLTFLDSIQEDSDVTELEERSKELIDFVAALPMGRYYSKRIGKRVKRSQWWWIIDPRRPELFRSQQLDQEREYRDKLRKERDKVYALVDDLLSLQKP